MKKSDILAAFACGWLASKDGKLSLSEAIAIHEKTIPKRTRKYFKKPTILQKAKNG